MTKAMQIALQYLGRREYSRHELGQKLIKGFAQEEVDLVLAQCAEQGFLCQQRFTESRVRHRLQQGYGPIRIAQELQEHHVDDEIIAHALSEVHWLEQIHGVLHKKFKQLNLNTQKDKIRRYLYQKGYPFSLIQQALRQVND